MSKMKFEITAVLSEMEELYSQPISPQRFQEYIAKLQGTKKGDMDLPIGGFNPMAKEHVLQKVQELKALEAEGIMQEAVNSINHQTETKNSQTIKVVLNLADDLKGGWTNHYTTDFDSKFKLNAFVSRLFCTPYFWTSESYSPEIIRQRTLEYVHRTIFWLENSKPMTLEDFLEQEVYVAQNVPSETLDKEDDLDSIRQLYEEFKNEDDYSLLFNFFYGDEASQSLNYPTFGVKDITGFDYAKILAKAS